VLGRRQSAKPAGDQGDVATHAPRADVRLSRTPGRAMPSSQRSRGRRPADQHPKLTPRSLMERSDGSAYGRFV
jgi:hypothetical protein